MKIASNTRFFPTTEKYIAQFNSELDIHSLHPMFDIVVGMLGDILRLGEVGGVVYGEFVTPEYITCTDLDGKYSAAIAAYHPMLATYMSDDLLAELSDYVSQFGWAIEFDDGDDGDYSIRLIIANHRFHSEGGVQILVPA